MFRDVPPWMCWVADAPPTASREPAAWRDPDDEMDMSELVPGEVKKERLDEDADVDVRKPIAVNVDISEGAKAVPGIDVVVGLASMVEMYFSAERSANGQ